MSEKITDKQIMLELNNNAEKVEKIVKKHFTIIVKENPTQNDLISRWYSSYAWILKSKKRKSIYFILSLSRSQSGFEMIEIDVIKHNSVINIKDRESRVKFYDNFFENKFRLKDFQDYLKIDKLDKFLTNFFNLF